MMTLIAFVEQGHALRKVMQHGFAIAYLSPT